MTPERIREILNQIHTVRVAVYGDFALDAYWRLDPDGGEMSVETGLRAQAVREQYYTLGGAANVTANLAALHPKTVQTIGTIGDDMFGRELQRQLVDLDVDVSGLTVQANRFDTITFSKRYINDVEEPRIDFGFFNKRSRDTTNAVLNHIESALQHMDALIFNQQVPGSLDTDLISRANELFDSYPNVPVVLDSRHYSDQFRRVIRKVNETEAMKIAGVSQSTDALDTHALRKAGHTLVQKSGKPVFITRGENGILAMDMDHEHCIGGIPLDAELDTVGAGDTVTASVAASLALGVDLKESAEFANLAAGVTVQKRFQTGTASCKEIISLAEIVHHKQSF